MEEFSLRIVQTIALQYEVKVVLSIYLRLATQSSDGKHFQSLMLIVIIAEKNRL